MFDRRPIAIAALFMVAAAGCATSEDSATDDEAQAMAVEPQEEPTPEAPELLASFEAYFTDAGAPRPEQVGQEFQTLVPRADLAIHTYCVDATCDNHITVDAADGPRSFRLSGTPIKAHHISDDGTTLAWPTHGQSSDDSQVAFLAIDALADQAQDIDGHPPEDVITHRLSPTPLHRLSALSARAVDEARDQCSGDAVHLPTLMDLSADSEPLSDELHIHFESWIDDDRAIFSTTTEHPGWSALILDLHTECMERYSTTEPWDEVAIDLHGPDHLAITTHEASAIGDDDPRADMALLTATLFVDADHQDLLDRLIEAPEATPDTDTGASATLIPRHVHPAELDWWHRQERESRRLQSSSDDPPTLERQDGRYGLPISIVIDGPTPERIQLDSAL